MTPGAAACVIYADNNYTCGGAKRRVNQYPPPRMAAVVSADVTDSGPLVHISLLTVKVQCAAKMQLKTQRD